MIDLDAVHLSKRYWIPPTLADAQRPMGRMARLRSKLTKRYVPFWALKDVSFSVERGETFGIIGHNGAGKSTLLKLFSEITAPTSGEIRLYRRLASLIEIGSGFHPELTGRENVFLSGSILGMRRAEIVAKLDQIVEFAGVGDFIDAPVKWYSSGMYVARFAVAAHLDSQILVVDEVLAVGDAEFQQKCYERIRSLRASGRTIVLISHDLWMVEQLCNRAILMNHGRIAFEGTAAEVVAHYREKIEMDSSHEAAPDEPPPPEAAPSLTPAVQVPDL